MSEKKEVEVKKDAKREKAPKAECGVCELRVDRTDPEKPTLELTRSDNTKQIVRLTPKYAQDLLTVFAKSQRYDQVRNNFASIVQLMQ